MSRIRRSRWPLAQSRIDTNSCDTCVCIPLPRRFQYLPLGESCVEGQFGVFYKQAGQRWTGLSSAYGLWPYGVLFRDDNIYVGNTAFCSPYGLGLQFNRWQCIAVTRSNMYCKFWINGECKAGPTHILYNGSELTVDPGYQGDQFHPKRKDLLLPKEPLQLAVRGSTIGSWVASRRWSLSKTLLWICQSFSRPGSSFTKDAPDSDIGGSHLRIICLFFLRMDPIRDTGTGSVKT